MGKHHGTCTGTPARGRSWRTAVTGLSALALLAGGLAAAGAASAAPTVASLDEPPVSAPVNTVRPKITGTPETGATLTVTSGTWDPAADTYRYDWQACATASLTLSCRSIGTDQPTLTLTEDQLDHRIRVRVSATNTAGSRRVNTSQTRAITAPAGPPPVNTGAPTISGSPAAGVTLTADPGQWTGNPTGYEYVWEACTDPASGTTRLNCTVMDTDDDTDRTVTPEADLNGSRIRVRVTAINPAGRAVAQSTRTRPTGSPTNTAVPTITGTARDGQMLTADVGAWDGPDVGYTFNWQSCTTNPPTGATCTTFRGEDFNTLRIKGELGRYIRIVVTASNDYGTRSTASAATPAVLPRVTALGLAQNQSCAVTTGGTVRCWGVNVTGSLDVPTDLGPVTQIGMGYYHACALRVDGDVRCWGGNDEGQGNVPGDLGEVSQIAIGDFLGCALTTSGSVRCWGDGAPAVPTDLGPTSQIAALGTHACALQVDGEVRCWGNNRAGQTTVPSDLGEVTSIAVGLDHTCAVTAAEQVRCWGSDNNGQSAVPAGLGIVANVAAGHYNTCAVTTSGAVRCWGFDDRGQSTPPTDLGPLDMGRSNPVVLTSRHACAIEATGTVRCWGPTNVPRTNPPADLRSSQ